MRIHTCLACQVLLPCLFGSLSAAIPAVEEKLKVNADTPYEYRQQHDPNGIGKFYLGREIAHVMGHQAADWLERPEREEEEKPSVLLESLKLKPGDAVADIGAGTGYLSWRLAQKVGEKGVVYAVEIQQEMLDLLGGKMAERKITNVKP